MECPIPKKKISLLSSRGSDGAQTVSSRPRAPAIRPPRRSVVVLGGANIDLVATADPLQKEVSNPGRVHVRAGGAGRNVAVNLARLGARTTFIGAVGNDPLSEITLKSTSQAGVDTSGVKRLPGLRNVYAAIVTSGVVRWAVSDMAAAESLTPDHIRAQERVIRRADAVVIDANLTPQAIAAARSLAEGRLLCLLPVSPAKASRVAPHLEAASCVVLSGAELEVLTGSTIREPADAARAASTMRHSTGLTAIVTLGSLGLVWVGHEVLHLPARPVCVVDPSGAGDAVAAGAIYAIMAGLSEEVAARVALAAGIMTVTVEESTHPDLSLKALYAYAEMAIGR